MSPPQLVEENCIATIGYAASTSSSSKSSSRPIFVDIDDNIPQRRQTMKKNNYTNFINDHHHNINKNSYSNNFDMIQQPLIERRQSSIEEEEDYNLEIGDTGTYRRRISYQYDNQKNNHNTRVITNPTTTSTFRKRIKSGGSNSSINIPKIPLYHHLSSLSLSLTSSLKISTTRSDRTTSLTTTTSSSYCNIQSIVSCFQHPTISLPLLVLIDMFAVSLVVPLLFQYYQRAGIHSANQRELLSSVFSAAQIVGGLSMGILSDAGAIERRTMLLISFSGSALSYALIVYGGLPALLLSRILVGLVKQTMTVVTTIMSKVTSTTNRAMYMGRLSASATVAWIVGPSIGSLLYKYVDTRAPAIIGCLLFILNTVLVTVLIPHDDHMEQQYYHSNSNSNSKSSADIITSDNDIESDMLSTGDVNGEQHDDDTPKKVPSTKGFITMLQNVQTCFTSKVLAGVVITKIIIAWVGQATNYSSLGSFYEDMYGLEAYHRGYISSYQQALQFIVQSFLVQHVLTYIGGERKTTCIFTVVTAVAIFLEVRRSLPLFLILLCPLISLSYSMINLSLQTLITHVAPNDAIFSVLATIDVLQNIAHVSVPFYRTTLFKFLRPVVVVAAAATTTTGTTTGSGIGQHNTRRMDGDPDPISWILASTCHWIIAAICVSYVLLVSNQKEWAKTEKEYERTHHHTTITNENQSSSHTSTTTTTPKSVKKGK